MTILRILKKFRIILSRHQKVRILELMILMVIAGVLEMLSVSLIIPFMNAVMFPDKVMNHAITRWICHMTGIGSHRSFLVVLAMILAVMYILKNMFLVFQLNMQNRFVYNNMFAVRQKLLAGFLAEPYEYFSGVSSGEVLRVIGSDTEDTFGLLTSVLSFCSEMVVSLVLIITIFFIAPTMTVGMAALLFVMVVVILKVIRPVLRRAGISCQESAAAMNQWLLQSVQGIKEIKIMKKEDFFKSSFETSGKNYVKNWCLSQTLNLIPRFMIEACTMGVFFIVVSVMIYRGVSLEVMIPMLSAVTMAAVRLLPAANRISQNMANIAFREPMLDKMTEHLRRAEAAGYGEENGSQGAVISGLKDCVRLCQVCYRYPATDLDILSEASMVIKRGMATAITGASGAGKTTAMDLLLGLLQPQKGSVMVDGTDIRLDMDGWLAMTGYIPQTIFMLDGNIRDNVAFGIAENEIDDGRVWEVLKEAALDQFVRQLPHGLDTQLGERGVRLSGGQRQRIGIARALYPDPDILFFDEATSALDSGTEAAIMESVSRLRGEKTIIIIAHRLSTIENCDVHYRVVDGTIRIEKTYH